MLSKTYRMFEDRLDYTKSVDGSWTAQFRGPFDVRVTEPSLDRCRDHAIEEFDCQLAAWIARAVERKQKRVARGVLEARRGISVRPHKARRITKTR